MWFLLLGCDPAESDDPAVTGWQIEPAVIESPLVSGASFAAADGDAIGLTFGQFLPGFAEGNPAWDVPTSILTIAMDDLVADAGSCPYEVRDGDTSTFSSDCRSRDGYEWVGAIEDREWDDGEIARHAYAFDVAVTGDVADAQFSTLSLAGTVVLSTLDGVVHTDVDLSASIVGYFEERGETDDAVIAAMADWQASGSVESTDSAILVEAAANVGGGGSVPMSGALAVDGGCPIEPTGELDLSGGVLATFDGANGCDACAEVESGGEAISQACAP